MNFKYQPIVKTVFLVFPLACLTVLILVFNYEDSPALRCAVARCAPGVRFLECWEFKLGIALVHHQPTSQDSRDN